ncbi:cytochrome P450 6B1-like [Rhodnius prolixus]|uniref:cytochrome P450 6B1-like n=1 Tax=Rhodnius prolixus TaxID=13249 RepID=UPI003D18F2FA
MFIQLLLLTSLLIVLFKFLTREHDYWHKRGVPYKVPYPFVGNLFRVIIKKETYQMALHRLYQESEGHRFYGIFNLMSPALLVRDVDIVNSILKSDFSSFSSRGLLTDHRRDPLSVNLFFMDGALWKRSRELLRHGFKSSRLRTLVPLIEQSAKLVFKDGGDPKCLEVKQLADRFSAAVIVGPVLGMELNDASLDLFVKECEHSFNVKGWQAVLTLMRLFVPKAALALGIKCVPQSTEDFFQDVLEKVKAGREEGVTRQDYIQTIFSLISGLSEHYSEPGFLDAALCGNFFIFALGGFETTATTITYALYELAQHPEVCEEARLEILKVTDGSKTNFTYDHLKELKYLQNVIQEVLRLHPPVTGFLRICTAKYCIPDSDVVLQPGDSIIISTLGLQTDSKYFDRPLEFHPSRFDQPITEGTFLPFANGPRTCIGMQLAMTVLKIVLCHILLNFDLSLDAKTPEKLEFNPERLIARPNSDVWIKFTPR